MRQSAEAGLLKTHARPIGVATMVVASVLAGSGLIFARLAYLGGTNTVTLQLVRFTVIASVLLGYFAWRRRPWRLGGANLWWTLGLGVLHSLSSYTYIGSLYYIPTSLAVIIVYTYPPLVSLIAHVGGTEAMSWRRAAALCVSFAGLAVALELSLDGLNLVGVGMAATASVTFAFALVFSSRMMLRTSPTIVQFHVAAVNMALLAAIGVGGGALALPASAIGWTGLAGMTLSFVVAFLAFGAAIHLIGPSLTAIVNNLEPAVAVLLSIVVLSEPFGPWQILGGGLVLTGVVLAR